MYERLAAIRRSLPEGSTLPDDIWRARHRGILVLLWFHALIIPSYALIRGFDLWHALVESLIVPAAAVVAALQRSPRRLRTAATSIGLLSSSAILVHLSGGLIEMHFHFFVMVAVVALYQDWIPFFAAIGYVFVHHGLMGWLDPSSVFNHAAAIANPWKWAAIHAFFITGISCVCLVTWSLNERILADRRRAEDRLREETAIVETLSEIGRSFAAELDLRSVVQHVTDAATELTKAAFGAFFYNVADSSGESYKLYTISGVSEESFAPLPMPRNTELFGPTFAGEAVVRIDDVTKDPRYGKTPPYYGMPKGHLSVRSYLAVPVQSRSGEVLGGLFFGHPQAGVFGETEERLAAGIAAHASVAIDNARLYDSERRARAASEVVQRRLEVMAEASRILATSLDLDAVLGEVASLMAPAVADGCEIYVIQSDGTIRLAAAHISSRARELFRDQPIPRVDPEDDDGPVARATRSGRTEIEQITPETLDRLFPDPEIRTAVALADPRSVLVAPLVRHGRVLGALALSTDGSSGRVLGPDDIPLAEEVARRISATVLTVNLYAAQRSAAETLQHSLLPERLPEIPGLAMGARYVAGGPGVEVGGDWYDVITLREGALGLAMGDVVGRGVAAASLMGQLRNALRAYAVDGHGPAETLEKLNDLLHEVGASELQMATLVFAIFEPESGSLRVANAGHPPPLVVGPDGEATYLAEATGVPLGAVRGARYAETLDAIAPGATLVLYTDGLVEDRSHPLDEGLERLRTAASEGPSDPQELCDTLAKLAAGDMGMRDDVAVLALRCVPLGNRLVLTLPSRPAVLKTMRAVLRRWLVEVGASEQEVFEILVAAGEACTNAIQHAGPGTRTFEFEAERNGEVRIVVRDTGKWRRARPTVGGRGLRVIEQFMDQTELVRRLDGTEIHMRRSLTTTAGKSL